jgi:hypothetical protein
MMNRFQSKWAEPRPAWLRRGLWLSIELIASSLEVYPLQDYGAVEIGVHRFHHPGDPTNVGEAKFVQLWKYKGATWKVTGVTSYDHQPAK